MPAVVHSSSRLTVMLEMLEEISRETEPNEAVRRFSSRMQELNGYDGAIAVSQRGLGPGEYKITRNYGLALPASILGGLNGELRTLEGVGLAPNPWRDWDLMPTLQGGFLGKILAGQRPRLINDLSIQNDPVLGDALSGMGSVQVTPVLDGGEMLNWLFIFRRDPDGCTQADLENQMLITNLFGSMTRNLVWAQRAQALNEALQSQFEEVARVQQSLLPERNPDIPGVTIATSYLTSDQAGGDYYDFFELRDGRWGVLIADVSGHGAGAATIMAMLHAILHGYPNLHDGPARVLKHANDRLIAARMSTSFVTAIFAVYDPRRRELVYSRAGHPPPVLKDTRSGGVRVLDGAGSLPLGVMEDFEPQEELVQLDPGETLILYTDGITEEFDDRRRMFGTEGLLEAVEHCSGKPECVVDSVHGALYRHTGHRSRRDDQTLVVINIHDEASDAVERLGGAAA